MKDNVYRHCSSCQRTVLSRHYKIHICSSVGDMLRLKEEIANTVWRTK